MTNAKYHLADGISASDFRLLEESVLHFENKNLFKLEGGHFTLGSLTHKLVLEPDDIGEEFIKETFDGPIILPGGGNNPQVVMQLGTSDADPSPSGIDVLIEAHNLIDDTPAEIADDSVAEHTVNTNAVYIGVDSNNMNAGQQLVMDFISVETVDGVTTNPNEVVEMEISLFNFGSEKSGDQLYITILTEDPSYTGTDIIGNALSETIILTGDPDITEEHYTVTSSTGGAFIGVEFLAGNTSSFKLGIESISQINYNSDFDMTLGYDITDADGDSDAGKITISMDGDETVIYDPTKASIDAGDEQDGTGGTLDDTLVVLAGQDIDFEGTPTIHNFEILELAEATSLGANALTNISIDDVIAMTDNNNLLTINKEVIDSIQFVQDGTETTAWATVDGGLTYTATSSGGVNVTVSLTGDTSNVTIASGGATIVDGIIEGLYYETSSGLSGYTEADGSFDYAFNDIVTFSLGGVTVGEMEMGDTADEKVFLQDLAGVERTDLNDEYVENMAVLLQSLDSDSGDNIVITDAMHTAFADESFDLATISEADLISVIEETGYEAVSEEDAMAHVADMLVEYTDLEAEDLDERVSDDEQLISGNIDTTISVTSIRTGVESGTGTATVVGAALIGMYGSITLAADGTYIYVVDEAAIAEVEEGEPVNDVFTYTLEDGNEVELVIPVMHTPVVENKTQSDEDVAVIENADDTNTDVNVQTNDAEITEGVEGNDEEDTQNTADSSNNANIAGILTFDEAQIDFASVSMHGDYDSIDLTVNGDHAIKNLSLEDVLDLTDGDKALLIETDAGDSVELVNEDGNVWEDMGNNIFENIDGTRVTVKGSGSVQMEESEESMASDVDESSYSDALVHILPGEDPELSTEEETATVSETASAPDPTVNVIVEEQIPVEVA